VSVFSSGDFQMLSVTNKAGPYVAPQVDPNPAFDEAKKQRTAGAQAVDFEQVLGESNAALAEQFEKDKKAVGENGELRIGESKSDKEFREMLERVSGKKQEKLKNKLDKDDYLNLMVTQLKYQDPTKPMENHEMATQLAQFNTVEQLMGVNKTLQSMQNQNAQANIDKLTPYLGRMVEVSGSKLRVSPEMKITEGNIDLSGHAGSVSVLIKDTNGSVVRTLGLGECKPGRHAIAWDGKTDGGILAKPGDYTFEVQASAQDGKPMEVKSSFTSKVEAISDIATGGKLETASGKVEAKDILAIRPDAPAAVAPVAAAPVAAAPVAAAPVAAAPVAAQPRSPQRAESVKKAEHKSNHESAASANATTNKVDKAPEKKAPEMKSNSVADNVKKAS
jgi:flagellar basal-body rod modification protein FlgD